MSITGMIGTRGWIGARRGGIVAAVPVVVIFADPVTGRLTCREEIVGGRHRDYHRLPGALYATENQVRQKLGLPPKPEMQPTQGEQLRLGVV